MLSTVISIAAGGALGAVLRYGVNAAALKAMGPNFPWGTLTVNVLGSFIMGLVIAVFAHYWQPSPAVKVFIVTGFLGAFTTFSTFSLDVSTLWERGEMLPTFGYIAASFILSVGALFLALHLIRSIAT